MQELKVNSITTAFAPNDSFSIEKHILENNTLYIDKERLLEYLQGFRQNTKVVYPKSLSESHHEYTKSPWENI